jgi:preprotein translocase subunit SecE
MLSRRGIVIATFSVFAFVAFFLALPVIAIVRDLLRGW